jgi:hypothetical protein
LFLIKIIDKYLLKTNHILLNKMNQINKIYIINIKLNN